MPMNPRKLVPTQEPGVLDFAPGAAAAYSLRNLSLSYASPVVTVRRSTDNAEADFTASEVSDGTLAGWAGADGFVKTWWDQSGNARHATQATTTAQPQIVDSGVLVTEGGKAAVRFDGVDDLLSVPSSTATFKFLHDGTKSAVFATLRFGDTSDPDTSYAAFGNNGLASANIGTSLFFDDRSALSFNDSLRVFVVKGAAGQIVVTSINNDTILPAVQTLLTVLLDVSNALAGERAKCFVQGAPADEGNVSTNAPTTSDATFDLEIGANGNSAVHLQGTISELIIYPTDMTALRTRIEGNLAWYY